MSSAPPPPYMGEKPVNYQQGPPPPQVNYQQAPPPLAMVQPVYIGAPMAIAGDYPMQCVCRQCGQQIVTRTEKKNGLLTWLICGGLTFFGLWLCCCIPFCVDSCKDTEHYCPSCNALLGVNKKL